MARKVQEVIFKDAIHTYEELDSNDWLIVAMEWQQQGRKDKAQQAYAIAQTLEQQDSSAAEQASYEYRHRARDLDAGVRGTARL